MNGLVEILTGSEDRGVQAVLAVLDKFGVVSYDRADDTLRFKKMTVSHEAFRLQIERALRRHE